MVNKLIKQIEKNIPTEGAYEIDEGGGARILPIGTYIGITNQRVDR